MEMETLPTPATPAPMPVPLTVEQARSVVQAVQALAHIEILEVDSP